jgi:hypothetical protein
VLTTDEPVIVACGDEAAPRGLVGSTAGWDGMCAAIALVPAAGAPSHYTRLSAPALGTPSLTAKELPGHVGENPNAGLLDLIDALCTGAAGSLRLDRGRGHGYCVTLSGAS